MKTGLYAITLNSEDCIEQWYSVAQQADRSVVVDVGSTDDTVNLLRNLGVTVLELQVAPWRFDVAANAAVALFADSVDVCVYLAIDEFMTASWRDLLDQHWFAGATKVLHGYVLGYDTEINSMIRSTTSRIHAAVGHTWRGRTNNILLGPKDQMVISIPDLVIYNEQPWQGERVRYEIELLKSDIEQYPSCLRTLYTLCMTLARKHEKDEGSRLSAGQKDAIEHLQLFLDRSDPSLAYERGMVHWQLSRYLIHEKLRQLLLSIAEYPISREPWLDLCEFYVQQEDWSNAYSASMSCLAIRDRVANAYEDPCAWSQRPEELRRLTLSRLKERISP